MIKVNDKIFKCIYDAIEYRDQLDANYVKVIWNDIQTPSLERQTLQCREQRHGGLDVKRIY